MTLPRGSILLAAFAWSVLAIGFSSTPLAADEPSVTADNEGLEFFEKQVRPIFAEHCHKCHGEKKQRGGLRLDRRAAVFAGGDTGAAIMAGQPDESLLIEAVRYDPDGYQMPPTGRLPDEKIAVLVEWVRRGAPWPEESSADEVEREEFDLAERAEHWSFQPLRQAAPPGVQDAAWQLTEIDRFLLARLEAEGLRPAPPTNRRAWIRRATFDLIGLPPTPDEIAAFLADDSPGAHERVIDRLLASPHYGERWGRHWLDLMRYAETHGHEFDYDIDNAYQYRDYVIRAFNADLPYDDFLVEHVAGDLLDEPRRHPREGFNESIIGTGFFHLGEIVHSPVDVRGDEAERFDNAIDVFGKAFLGLTIACARCHDHKFDAISTKDYYALAGFLQSSRYQQAFLDSPQQNREAIEKLQVVANRRQQLARTALARRLRPGVESLAEMLLAAREAADSPEELSVIAARRGLSVDLLTAWREHLEQAADEPGDLFHRWATLADAGFETSSASRSPAPQSADAESDDADLVVFEDFQRPGFQGWYETGEAFDGRARPAGEVLLDRRASEPLGVARSGVADGGRLSKKLEGVLRSQTFDIQHDFVWHRVAGRGRVNVVVDSHRLIHGPLHGSLRKDLDGDEQFRWVSQNVADYRGHRAYVEIIDDAEGAIAVDEIVFSNSDSAPPSSQALVDMTAGEPHDSPESRAESYQHELLEALGCWSDGKHGEPTNGAAAQAIDWLVRHRNLFGVAQEWEADVADALTALAEQQTSLTAKLRPSRRAPAMADGTPENEYVHIRGNHKTLGEVVPRRFLEAIDGQQQAPLEETSLDKDCGRLALARRLAAESNPLPGRVMVNRIWRFHFGEGLVRSVDNFGRLGESPTHPELLDWLAGVFIADGWSIKAMHRRMMLSAAYRMSGEVSPAAEAADPTNQWLHHLPARRLEAEVIRDAMLAVSGRLDRSMHGPSVPTHLTEFMSGRGRPKESGPLDGDGRRGIYLAVRRNFLAPLFTAFDFPSPATTNGRRSQANVPAQALALLNNPFVLEQAEAWADRVIAQESDARKRITNLYVTAFAREPYDAELEAALRFVEDGVEQDDAAAERHAWAALCHVLLNTKEFIFIP